MAKKEKKGGTRLSTLIICFATVAATASGLSAVFVFPWFHGERYPGFAALYAQERLYYLLHWQDRLKQKQSIKTFKDETCQAATEYVGTQFGGLNFIIEAVQMGAEAMLGSKCDKPDDSEESVQDSEYIAYWYSGMCLLRSSDGFLVHDFPIRRECRWKKEEIINGRADENVHVQRAWNAIDLYRSATSRIRVDVHVERLPNDTAVSCTNSPRRRFRMWGVDLIFHVRLRVHIGSLLSTSMGIDLSMLFEG
eukprot:GEMP01068619.1.p1 GENE.GEMP01068619.1~~GEMP01068619.1.p1  ORF type:complete len:251 (-),score=33.64 GEMP01068619.1:304-1056(-)